MFITGGTGFFGIWLLESFEYINNALTLNAKATVLTRNPAEFAAKAPHLAQSHNLRFLQGDIASFTFPDENFDYIIHAATEVSASLNNKIAQDTLATIEAGTKRILDFASQANVRKFLFTSSGAVYGPQPPQITHLQEDDLGDAISSNLNTPYAEGKRKAELMLASRSKDFSGEFKIARCFSFVGPHLPLDAHYAVGNFIRDALTHSTITIRGDGTPRRSYLYASDLAVWLWTILFTGTPLHAYNVGSSQAISIYDLALLVKNVLSSNSLIKVLDQMNLSLSSSNYIPSTERAEVGLGLRESVSLAGAILKTGNWHRSAKGR